MANRFHRDVWLGAVLALFSLFIFVQAIRIQGDAAYLPSVLAVLMGICSVCIALKGLRMTREMKGEYHYSMTVKGSRYALLFMLFILIYFLGFQYITYWVATPVFMILAQKYLKLKSMKINLIITAVYIVVCYGVFVSLLQLPIYKVGILGEWFRF